MGPRPRKFDPKRAIGSTLRQMKRKGKAHGIFRVINISTLKPPALSKAQWGAVEIELAVQLIRNGVGKKELFRRLSATLGKERRKEFERIKRAVEQKLGKK